MSVSVERVQGFEGYYIEEDKIGIRWGLTLSSAVILFMVFLFRITVRLEVVNAGYELGKQRKRLLALDMKRRDLELQRSVLYRPEVLEKRAEEELGLTFQAFERVRKVAY